MNTRKDQLGANFPTPTSTTKDVVDLTGSDFTATQMPNQASGPSSANNDSEVNQIIDNMEGPFSGPLMTQHGLPTTQQVQNMFYDLINNGAFTQPNLSRRGTTEKSTLELSQQPYEVVKKILLASTQTNVASIQVQENHPFCIAGLYFHYDDASKKYTYVANSENAGNELWIYLNMQLEENEGIFENEGKNVSFCPLKYEGLSVDTKNKIRNFQHVVLWSYDPEEENFRSNRTDEGTWSQRYKEGVDTEMIMTELPESEQTALFTNSGSNLFSLNPGGMLSQGYDDEVDVEKIIEKLSATDNDNDDPFRRWNSKLEGSASTLFNSRFSIYQPPTTEKGWESPGELPGNIDRKRKDMN